MGPSGGCHVSDNFDVGIGGADLLQNIEELRGVSQSVQLYCGG